MTGSVLWDSSAILALLDADKAVKAVLSRARLANLFDLGYHLKHVDTIFARVFGTK